jgi:Fe-S oxidoreductase
MPASETARHEIAALAAENRLCYQCGQCTAVCPSGADLDAGPRRVMRSVLTQDVERLLASEDVWRCTGCGACTDVCPMELDVAGTLARLRALGHEGPGGRCPERAAAQVAARRLADHDEIDAMAFGAAMALRGHVPADVVSAAGAASRLARHRLRRSAPDGAVAPPPAVPAPAGSLASRAPAAPRTFFPGCALRQDPPLLSRTRTLANELGLPLDEPADAVCCGHPSRGAAPARFASDGEVLSACPACDSSLREIGVATKPLWEALVDRAAREERRLRAAEPAFVPYVGCLSERGAALAALATAGELASSSCLLSYPSLHAGCCGALGGMYRQETHATRRLLDYAAAREAPVVTTCLLCRDNLRSAARRRGPSVPIYFWPEFFDAAEPAGAPGGDHD